MHQGEGGKMVSGQLEVAGDRLRFSSGDLVVEIAVDGLNLRTGGHNDEQLFFEHSAQPGWILTTSDHAILTGLNGIADPILQARIRTVGRRRASLVSRLAIVGGSVVLMGMVIVAVLFSQKSRLARLAAKHVPQSVEEQFGDAVFQSVQQQTKIIEDARWSAQVAVVTARLLPAVTNSGYRFRFHVAESDQLNAFAIPGGHVVIYTGLLKAVKRPEELAGVLAHEMAHVTQRHSLRGLVETLGLSLIVQTIFGDASGLIAAASQGSEALLQQKFSRDTERDADDVGWEYLVVANIDPRGMIEFFRTMQAEMAGNPAAAAADGSFSFLSTHPATAERIARLEAKWRDLPRKEGFVQLLPSSASGLERP